MSLLAAVDRLNQLEAIGLERDFTEAEIAEIGSVMEALREVEPTWEPARGQVVHPTIAFWQRLAAQPARLANIKAMHKTVAPHILHFFTGKYANLMPR